MSDSSYLFSTLCLPPIKGIAPYLPCRYPFLIFSDLRGKNSFNISPLLELYTMLDSISLLSTFSIIPSIKCANKIQVVDCSLPILVTTCSLCIQIYYFKRSYFFFLIPINIAFYCSYILMCNTGNKLSSLFTRAKIIYVSIRIN